MLEEIEPGYIESYLQCGNLFLEYSLFQKAIHEYEKVLCLDKNHIQALLNCGNCYQKINNFNKALEIYNYLIDFDPKNLEALNNRAVLYKSSGEYEEAIKSYLQILSIDKHHAFTLYNLGLIKLYKKEFQDGWHLYENRWQSSEKEKYLKTSKPELTDFSVIHKTIFIWAEQGIGDQILYSSLFYDAFKTKNHFYVSLDPRLIPLYKRSFSHLDHITFISIHEKLSESKYDFHLPIGSLGKFFRNSIEDFNSHPKAYLKTDETQVRALRKKIKKNARNICGISWMSKNIDVGKEKSLSLTELLPILSIPNTTFISLQYGDTKEEVGKILDQHGIEIYMIDEIDNFNDLDGLASLINACDYVVTTSNVTAHIAGALNKETYLLIPYAHGRIWYWGESENQCLWYPAIHIYQCDDSGLWDHPIKHLSARLKDRVYD